MAIRPNTNFRRPDKSKVQAIVTYRDGATAYLIVPTMDQRELMAIARERQAAGEIPAGEIAEVRRAR